jgi:Cu(I)/Ag(I) efflux system membrane fusion protein
LGVFNVGQNYSSLIKVNQSIKILSELDATAYVTAKVNFIETQLNQNEKTNRIRVYLNNANLKYPYWFKATRDCRNQPISGIWIKKQALVTIGTQK